MPVLDTACSPRTDVDTDRDTDRDGDGDRADSDRGDIARLIDEGLRHSRRGLPDAARASLEGAARLAERLGDTELLTRAALEIGTLGGVFEVLVDDVDQLARLDRLIERGPIGEPRHASTQARLLARASVARSMACDRATPGALAERAMHLASAGGDAVASTEALAAGFDAHGAPEHHRWRCDRLDALLTSALATGDPELELLARRHRLTTYVEGGRLREARAEHRAFARLADLLGAARYRWYAALVTSTLAALGGDGSAAETANLDAQRLGRDAGSLNAALLADWAQRAHLLAASDVDAALVHFRAHAARHPDTTMGLDAAPIVLARYGLDTALVREALAVLPDDLLTSVPRDAGWLHIACAMAEASVHVGDHRFTDELEAQLAPFAQLAIVVGQAAFCRGPVSLVLARLAAHRGDPDAALVYARGAQIAVSSWAAPALMREIATTMAVAARPADGGGGQGRERPAAAAWRRDGDTWSVTFADRTVAVRHTKGMADLARLLAAPEREVHALELATGSAHKGGGVDRSGLPVLDDAARRDYERRIRDLQADIDEAAAHHDTARDARARDEQEWLVRELANACGLGGRPRTVADPAERARKAVTMRVRETIARLATSHPALGRHLRHSIATGAFCCYRPERPVTWSVVDEPPPSP